MNTWWQQRLPRERLALSVMLSTLLGFAFYGLFWQPMQQQQARLQQQITSRSNTLQWLQEASQRYTQLLGSSPTNNRAHNRSQTVLAIADRALNQHQLQTQVQRIVPKGRNAVSISLEAVDFDKLLRWIAVMQDHGLTLSSANIAAKGTPPKVDARLQLARR